MILKINSKKSQTEIFGVVLIVVILTMFGLYMLISDQARNRKSISASLADSESAQSFVDALINMKTDQNMLVSDVINYCYDSRKNYLCETGNPNILDCCDYADQVIRNSLSATFDDWKHSYRLTLRKGNDIRIPINGAQLFTNDPLCTGASEKEQPGFFYLPGSPPIIIKMELCKV